MSKRIVHYPNTDRYGLLSKNLDSQICEGSLDCIQQTLKRLEREGY